MTAREFLERPYNLYKKLQYLEKARQHYTELMYSVRSVNYSEPKVDKSPSNTTPNMYGLMKLDETEQEIKEVEAEYERVCKEVDQKIDELDNDNYKMVLKYKYLEFKNMFEIAEILFINVRTAQRWHRNALVLVHII